MSDQEQDRSEAATPHRLKEAQNRGQVNKSQEVIFAAIIGVVVLVLFSVGPSIAREELQIMVRTFEHATSAPWSDAASAGWVFSMFSATMICLLPLFAAIVAAVVVSTLAQIGAVFSFHPLTPDFQRLSPANGLKRLFSMTVLYNAVKSIVKLGVLCWVLWIVLKPTLQRLFGLIQIDARAHASLVMAEVGPLLFKMGLVVCILALIDSVYTRWDFSKKMRMSRREVRDEHKNREGDPRIRSRLRQLRAEMAKQSRSLRNVPDADVLIVNPTHLAVAISYKHGEMPAPKMLAKGAGTMAAAMRDIARKHNIPIVQNVPLARAMYKRLRAEEYVPEDLYPLAAKILLWVYAARNARTGLATPR